MPTTRRIVQIACAANDTNGDILYALGSDGLVYVQIGAHDSGGWWRVLPSLAVLGPMEPTDAE